MTLPSLDNRRKDAGALAAVNYRPFSATPGHSNFDLTTWQVALGLLLLIFWELTGWAFGAMWISRPSLVVVRILQWSQNDLHVHFLTTVAEIALGLSIGVTTGILAGLLLGSAPVLAAILRPIVVAFYSVPLVTLAPLFILWFGFGIKAKVVLTAIVVFFILFFNTLAGAQRVDRDLIESVQLMGANRRELFRKVILPGCMAWIITGFKIALPYSLVAAITGEMLGAPWGLGSLISQSASRFDMTGVYAALFIVMVMAVLISQAAAHIERLMLRWRNVE